MEFLRAIVNLFFLPPGGNLLLLVMGIALLRYRPRIARALLWTGTGTLLLLAMPMVSNALTRATGSFEVFHNRDPAAQAIVILAAERRSAPEFGGATVGPRTLERLQIGARIARETGLPVLLSGGRLRVQDRESTAELMERSLEGEFGLSARWLEVESRTTWENAQRSAAILQKAGVHEVILVTHYAHMHRAAADFAAAGITTQPAPTCFPVLTFPTVLAALWPRTDSLRDSSSALHELYGLLGHALGAQM